MHDKKSLESESEIKSEIHTSAPSCQPRVEAAPGPG